jgi:hypothetical protein
MSTASLAQLWPGRLASCALAVMLAALPTPAHAQHGTAGYGVIPMPPHDSALLEVQNAEFELPGRSGVWQTFSPRLEFAVSPWLSLAARPGVARVEYADGASAVGLSDTELVGKLLVARSPAWRTSLSAGVSLEVPTGDADTGIGNGHVSLLPFVSFMTMPSRVLMLHVMAGDRVVLADTDHDASTGRAGHEGHAGHGPAPHGSVIMPHEAHELTLHAGACITLAQLVISPSLEWMQVLSSGRDSFLTALLELAFVPRRELRLAVSLDLPLLRDPRFEWRSRLMAALLW